MTDGRAEIARVTLEGVALHLRLILDVLHSQGAEIVAMRLIGGGAKELTLCGRSWPTQSSYRSVLPALTAEATSLGAAIAGGIGVGIYPDFGVTSRLIPVREAERPDPATVARDDDVRALRRNLSCVGADLRRLSGAA